MDQNPGQNHKTKIEKEHLKVGVPGKCPYIGIKSDPDTSLDYPSIWNACHRTRTTEVPLLDHQNTTCLTPEHTVCPVFMSVNGEKFPPELIEHVQHRSRMKKHAWIISVTLGLAALVILFLIIKVLQPELIPAKLTPSSPVLETTQSVSVMTEDVTETKSVFIETPVIEVVKTETSAPSGTSVVAEIVHKVDVPIGTDYQFIIHQTLEGESLEQYAVLYNTNRETITQLNYFLPVPLWVNWLVIIPVNLTEIGDLPTFEAYLVTEEVITIEKLSEKLAVDPAELSFYNGIEVDHVMRSGDWLIIPREGHMLYNP
jgi:hypothetical protein